MIDVEFVMQELNNEQMCETTIFTLKSIKKNII